MTDDRTLVSDITPFSLRMPPPKDAYGPDYILYHMREAFEDLCRMIGFSNARAEVAEIINDHASGERTHNHV